MLQMFSRFEFQKAIIQMYEELHTSIDIKTQHTFANLTIAECQTILSGNKFKRPSATWTYLVNDNPFENMIGLQMIGNIGMQVGTSILGIIFIIRQILRKFRRRNK